MRVGLLTSWRVPCGVGQYSARLADALARLPDVDPVILAGRADEHRSVPEESEHEVHDAAKIGLWRDDGAYSMRINDIAALELDVIHVQYQSMLFQQPCLARLASRFRGEGPMAITFHDNCQRPDFPYPIFDLQFSHRWNIGPPNVEVIPFPVEERPLVVRSFGLGRTRDDYVGPICARRGWVFESAASHEPIHGGGQAWRTHEDLIAWLRGADAIVLWYDDNGMAGSSQAVRTAMAARRPVITNDTTWFSDMPNRATGYQKVHDLDQLEGAVEDACGNSFVRANSWDLVAARLVERYCSAMVPRAASSSASRPPASSAA